MMLDRMFTPGLAEVAYLIADEATALLRKAVSLGPEYVIHGPPKVGQQYATNRSWILDQGASGVGDEGWVRLWAPFYMLFPGERGVFRTPQGLLDERVPPGAGLNSAGKAVLDRLDAEIAWACRDCKNVAVTVYGYPSWSNGTPAIDADSDPHTDALFQPWDRTDRNAWNRWRDNTLGTFAPWGGGNRPDNWKKLYFKLPTDGFGMDSAWGCFFDWLYWRYSPDNPYRPVVPVGDPAVNQQATITAIEYVNEPNLQLWPQMDRRRRRIPTAPRRGRPPRRRSSARSGRCSLPQWRCMRSSDAGSTCSALRPPT